MWLKPVKSFSSELAFKVTDDEELNYPGTSSFQWRQYPSQLPLPMVERMREVSRRVIERIGLDNSTSSIECFCEPESGEVRLLEINPRHSQSHAELFEYVDGVPNHHCMVNLGLGRDPQLPHRAAPATSPRSGTTAASRARWSPESRPNRRSPTYERRSPDSCRCEGTRRGSAVLHGRAGQLEGVGACRRRALGGEWLHAVFGECPA